MMQKSIWAYIGQALLYIFSFIMYKALLYGCIYLWRLYFYSFRLSIVRLKNGITVKFYRYLIHQRGYRSCGNK